MLALYRDKLKWNEAYPHKLITAWRRILSTLFISYVSWLLAMIESSCCFQKCNRNWGHRCLYNGLSESLDVIYIHPLELMKWGVMVVCHCCSWWRWWSETLWVTLIKLWLHTLSSSNTGVFSAISWIWTMNSTISEIWTITLSTKCLLLWSMILLSTKTPSDPYWICGSHLNFEYVLG
jgi:hypothetical protein